MVWFCQLDLHGVLSRVSDHFLDCICANRWTCTGRLQYPTSWCSLSVHLHFLNDGNCALLKVTPTSVKDFSLLKLLPARSIKQITFSSQTAAVSEDHCCVAIDCPTSYHIPLYGHGISLVRYCLERMRCRPWMPKVLQIRGQCCLWAVMNYSYSI